MRGWAGQYRYVPALGQRWPGVPLRRGSCTKANSRITSNQSNQVRDTPHKPDSRVIVSAHTTAYYRLPRIPLIPGSTFRVPEASSLIFICIKLRRAAGGEVLTSSNKFPKWHFLLLCGSLVLGSKQVISITMITSLFSTMRCRPEPVFSYKLRYMVGLWLIEMTISTNQKPTIYIVTYCTIIRAQVYQILITHTILLVEKTFTFCQNYW